MDYRQEVRAAQCLAAQSQCPDLLNLRCGFCIAMKNARRLFGLIVPDHQTNRDGPRCFEPEMRVFINERRNDSVIVEERFCQAAWAPFK